MFNIYFSWPIYKKRMSDVHLLSQNVSSFASIYIYIYIYGSKGGNISNCMMKVEQTKKIQNMMNLWCKSSLNVFAEMTFFQTINSWKRWLKERWMCDEITGEKNVYKKKDYWLHIQLSYLENIIILLSRGLIIEFVGFLRDITGKKKQERSWYKLLMRPYKVETAIQWFRMIHLVLAKFSVHAN